MRVRALSERVWGKGAELAAGARVKGKPGAGRAERRGRTRRRGAGGGGEPRDPRGSLWPKATARSGGDRAAPTFFAPLFLCSPGSCPPAPPSPPLRCTSTRAAGDVRGPADPRSGAGMLWGDTAASGANPPLALCAAAPSLTSQPGAARLCYINLYGHTATGSEIRGLGYGGNDNP